MFEYISTFLAMFIVDILYSYYIKAIQDEEALKAGLWAGTVYAIASVSVINFTINHWLIIPAALGAALGTYVGIRMRQDNGPDEPM
jgi:uncharacterized membrane protein YfcA